MEKSELTIEKLLENIDIPVIFFKLLNHDKKDIYVPLIQEIQKNIEIDYFKLGINALSSSMNAWSISRPLENIVSFSELNTSTIIDFYRKIYKSMNDDLASYVQYDITKELVHNNLDFTHILLEKLLLISEPFVVYHISTILDILHNVHLENQYVKIMGLIKKSNSIFHVRSAINVLMKLDLLEEQVHEIFELFKMKYEVNNDELDAELINSAYHFIKKYPLFKKFIVLYADSKNIQTLYQLSRVLHLDKKESFNEEWFIQCFLALSFINIEYGGIIRNIDLILSELIQDGTNYEMVKSFLYQWIEKSDLSSNFSDEMLPTFIAKCNKTEFLSRFITESLILEDKKIHRILPHLIKNDLSLDIEIMQTFSQNDFVYISKKILGYFYEFKITTTLIFSILSVKNTSTDIRDLVIEIFVNHIGKNYAHDTLEYFEQLNNKEFNRDEKEAKKTILKYLKYYRETIQKLPNLKELKASSKQNRLISRAQHISMSEIMKGAREDSFLGSLGTTVMLSQGKGWFSDRDGLFTDVSYMGRISHSVTMPSSIRSHPIHFEWERFHFRIAEKEL